MTTPRFLPTGPLLFLDSADPDAWERLLPLGLLHGATTNPLLLERAGQACTVENLARLAGRAAGLGAREIQLQTWGTTVQEMVDCGMRLAGTGRGRLEVTIKVPATTIGWQVAARLRRQGCAVTITATYTPGQVLASASLGAAYAAPYLGRLDDAGRDGAAVLQSMRKILAGTGADTRLLVASLRSAERVIELAELGFDTFTFGPAVAEELLASALTDSAAADFQRAAEAMGGPGSTI